MSIHPLAWRAILDGRPWACTEAEMTALANVVRALRITSPRGAS